PLPELCEGHRYQNCPMPEIDTFVEEMIPAYGVTLLHGKSSAGKSALAWEIANAVQTGKPLLGLRTVKTDVLYISLDMTQRSLLGRWRGSTKHPKPKEEQFKPNFYIYTPRIFRLAEDTDKGEKWRKDEFKPKIEPFGLIIIDALGNFVEDTKDE